MAEITVPLKVLGVSLAFEVLDDSQRVFTTGTIPIHEKDVNVFDKSNLVKYICEKCNEGELVFDPSKEYTETTFTHSCTNCENTEVFDKIYPSMRLLGENEMDKVKSFNFTFSPEYFDEEDENKNKTESAE